MLTVCPPWFASWLMKTYKESFLLNLFKTALPQNEAFANNFLLISSVWRWAKEASCRLCAVLGM